MLVTRLSPPSFFVVWFSPLRSPPCHRAVPRITVVAAAGASRRWLGRPSAIEVGFAGHRTQRGVRAGVCEPAAPPLDHRARRAGCPPPPRGPAPPRLLCSSRVTPLSPPLSHPLAPAGISLPAVLSFFSFFLTGVGWENKNTIHVHVWYQCLFLFSIFWVIV